MKRHESCKTCGYLALDFVVGNDGEIVAGNYYCEINNENNRIPTKNGWEK